MCIVVIGGMDRLGPHYREEAVAEILRCSGSHFDPKVVRVFLAREKELHSLLHGPAATSPEQIKGPAMTDNGKGETKGSLCPSGVSPLGLASVPRHADAA